MVSAREEIYVGDISMLIANGHSGEIGILAGHTPLITLLKPGPMRMKSADGSSEEVVYVSGGVLEVQPHVVTVLADSAERAYDLDEAKLPKLVAMLSRLWQIKVPILTQLLL